MVRRLVPQNHGQRTWTEPHVHLRNFILPIEGASGGRQVRVRHDEPCRIESIAMIRPLDQDCVVVVSSFSFPCVP